MSITLKNLQLTKDINLQIKQKLEEILPRFLEIKKDHLPMGRYAKHFEIEKDSVTVLVYYYAMERNRIQTYNIPFYCFIKDNWENELNEEIRLEEEAKEREKQEMYAMNKEYADRKELWKYQKLNEFMEDKIKKIYNKYCKLHDTLPGEIVNFTIGSDNISMIIRTSDGIKSHGLPNSLLYSATWEQDLKDLVEIQRSLFK